jgi:hypothetical protein
VLETCRCRCRTLVFAYRGCRRDLFVPVAKRRHHLCAVNSIQYQREKVKRISIYRRSLLLLTSLSSEIYSLQNPPTAC